ncbi:MAG: DUF255 domain-containing protein [Bacteroidales bacterium]|nr:DUF255 domain-containing protein [Bacteroidales bacterium]MDD3664570.1 DUF255 domain-containing protein [Bacteroidales bacterium]
MTSFSKNNLHLSTSPYLRQHAENPVWWQEFTPEVLEHARRANKPIFISSGYSTCHWCHVMASEAFSDQTTADFLAQNFVSIKLDREMHPDVDSFLMTYIQSLTGQGGWPLNVFLTPDLKPFYALTYAPPCRRQQHPSFLEIVTQLVAWYSNGEKQVKPFKMSHPEAATTNNPDYNQMVMPYLDRVNGGTSGAPKFPPHALLFNVLHQQNRGETLNAWLTTTLDTLALSGLHDHLQGGFFRYCVDDNWNIPHFEKMLYDQSMMLINYSLAARVFSNENYRDTARSVVDCLNQTFTNGNAFASAHDADTNHHEGLTYLWSDHEISETLTDALYQKFSSRYSLIPFEKLNHLRRNLIQPADALENQMLQKRNQRPQPFRDDKIITSWNAWAAIGLVFAHRYARLDTLNQTDQLFQHLFTHHINDRRVAHCMSGSRLQPEGYLEDAASMFLLATFLFEERLTEPATVELLREATLNFRKHGRWYDSTGGPLGDIPAGYHDHPFPSAASTADAALLRWDILQGESPRKVPVHHPLMAGFANHFASISDDNIVIAKGPAKANWELLPIGALQCHSNTWMLCEGNTCKIPEWAEKQL